ncbi:sugar-phosphatase [Morganella psychrotolerans]|uniref:Sugar-phosphatase n=1 Tax=Morganella psychrotolerans TaxID=368603 RepID=A0A1B8HQS5_9GAMM|nr:sugar-phosphatase [Morganella psychrotolerans]OBU11620.1 sugar-phosphatase [Morganella psychrotolerans]
MSVKLIAIDLDGTLLNSYHQITPAVSAEVSRAKEKGLHIILTSGRPFNGILPYLTELGLNKENCYCISNNGAVIHEAQTGDPVMETLMDFEDYRYFESLAREINVHFHVLSSNEMYTANRDISYYTLMDAYLTQTQLNYRPSAEMDSDMMFSKFMMIDNPVRLNEAAGFIPQVSFDNYNILRTAPHFVEISAKNATKGNAVALITEKLGLTPDKVMCIGDQNNDISMLEYAGVGVAMGNAADHIKQKAGFVATTNDDDGVAVAIQKFV